MFSQNYLLHLCFVYFFFVHSIFGQTTSQEVAHYKSINQNLNAPTRIAVDKSDHIYVIDSFFNTINKYDSSGNLLKTYNLENYQPVCIAINSKNQLFFGAKNNGNIYRLHENESVALVYSGLVTPVDMVFSPDDQLYISDGNLKVVIKIDASGALKQTISNISLLSPSSLVFDQQNKRLLVADAGIVGGGGSFGTTPCTIHVFNLDGTYVGNFGSGAKASLFGNGTANIGDAKFNRIQGMSLGKCNNIYVSDPFQGSVTVFNENLTFITRFGAYGTTLGQLNVPLDIEFDSQERIIISSMNNGSIEIFSIADVLPSSNIYNANQTICSETSTTSIPIHFTGTAPWNFTYSHNGVAQTPITTSENPYLLVVSEAGVYEVSALSDLNTIGTCFTGSATISKQLEAVTSLIQNSDAVLCEGEFTNIEIRFTGNGPWTFIYTVDGLNPQEITTSVNPFLLQVSKSGLYEISHIEANGCVGTSSGKANIQVNEKPTAKIQDLNNRIYIYPGKIHKLYISFTGTGPWTFTYTNNFKNPKTITTSDNPYILSVFEEGNYSITSVSDVYCTNSNLDDYPEIVFINTSITNRCSNNSEATFDLRAIENNIFINPEGTRWFLDRIFTKEITNPDLFKSSASTVYALNKIHDAYHIDYAEVQLAVSEVPLISVSASNTVVCKNTEVIIYGQGGVSYQWDQGVIDGVAFTPTETKTYTVVGTDANGCSNTASIVIEVDQNCTTLSVNDYLNSNSKNQDALLLYPNPSKGEFTLKMMTPTSVNSNINITILNPFGQIIINEIIKSDDINYSSSFIFKKYHLINLKKGVYFINVRTDNYIQTERIIVVD